MKHIKAGYVVHGELKNFTESDARSLDVINIAFCHCRNSKIVFEHEEDLIYLDRIRKYNPDLKILFSVGGWGSGGFSPMAATVSNRLSFASSCLEFVDRFGLDGIDIDWEYPCIDWAGIEASPSDKHNYTLMLEQIREVFNTYWKKKLMLTVAVGNDSYFINNTEMDKVAKALDYVSIMTYDMRGCGDIYTGHHTNLMPYIDATEPTLLRSVDHSVKIFCEAGVPKEKTVIGAAFYSRMWRDVNGSDSMIDVSGLFCPASPGGYGPGYGTLYADYIGKNGFTEYFDEIAKAPYLFDGSTFISYDNERSIAEKCAYVKENGLLGIMYWEHSCDNTRKLLKAIDDNL